MAQQSGTVIVGGNVLAADLAQGLSLRAPAARSLPVRCLAVDPYGSDGARFADPARPAERLDLVDLLQQACPRTLLLLAATSPSSGNDSARGDLAVADEVAAALSRLQQAGAPLPALLLLSSTAVYGTAAGSPLVFDEQAVPPREDAPATAWARWAEDLREVERRIVRAAVQSGAQVGVLRAASIVGGPVDSPLAALLRAQPAVRALGWDPPCQAIHYDDLLEALALAVEGGCAEVLNLVGRETLALSRMMALAGVLPLALPGPLADRFVPASADPRSLRRRTLVDGRRATAVLGFRPRRSLEEALRGH